MMKTETCRRCTLSLLVVLALASSFSVATDEPPSQAPGYGALPYSPPKPGSYRLPSLGEAADGQVLESSGQPATLHQLYADRMVLLSFIYATCDDANGCPLATMVLHRIQSALTARPELKDRLRLITLSFNPDHDTPEVMAKYGQSFQSGGIDWHFLTTRSETELQPILRDYQQSVDREVDAQGRPTGKFSHLLRVYLIDEQRRIRNSYTVSVLHPDLVLADIETLRLESSAPARPAANAPTASPVRAGDDKSGYERADYQTKSAALAQRQGQPADLFRWARQPVLGLPSLPALADNPLTREKIALGRKLFYDRRLSLNQTFSCAMCHIPEQGFTSQEQATAIGIEGRSVRRNAPTIYNVAYLTSLFLDGRESTLENQVWGPFLAANEMGNPSVGAVIDNLKSLPDYRGLFEKAFRRGPSMDTVGQAIASYERTLVSGDSPFDRWHYGHRADALSPVAQRGYALFAGKAGCVQCHTIGAKSALFTDNQLHNTGLGYQESMRREPATTPVQVAPGVTFDLSAASIGQVAETRPGDLGRYEVTQNPADRWKYRTPSLRNAALTAPYMHHGGLATLLEVVEFYNRGGVANENLDPLIQPLHLGADDIDSLVAFLESLTGSGVDTLVSDAWSAPVGER
jgi:cytochrome c peroxidase